MDIMTEDSAVGGRLRKIKKDSGGGYSQRHHCLDTVIIILFARRVKYHFQNIKTFPPAREY
jgi:hypothetical protein